MPAPKSKADVGLYISPEVFQLPYSFITRGVFAEIHQLSKRDEVCTASDAHFVERFDVSRDTISRAIQQLEAAGLLHKSVDKASGNLRRLKPTDGPTDTTSLAAKSDKGLAAKSGDPSAAAS
ncbi:MAG: helix-turn-helix domain-containing protein [Hymenobacteraceae bacterium]|nr:helix-turn-helix domain-containing protein [Hymenobacteraceae bacterium]